MTGGLTPTGWGVAAGAAFAAMWGLAGARGLAGAWRRRIAVLVLMASAGLIARAFIAPPRPDYAMRFDAPVYGYAAAFEIVGVVLAALWLRAPGAFPGSDEPGNAPDSLAGARPSRRTGSHGVYPRADRRSDPGAGTRSSRRGLIGPVVAIITGLHFVGLWIATGQRLFLGVTLGLCAAGLIALGWPGRPGGAADPRLAIAGLGSALVLWAACLSSLA